MNTPRNPAPSDIEELEGKWGHVEKTILSSGVSGVSGAVTASSGDRSLLTNGAFFLLALDNLEDHIPLSWSPTVVRSADPLWW